MPFFMAVANSKVVQASAIALNYGPNFRYYERVLSFPRWKTNMYFGIFTIFPGLATLLILSTIMGLVRIPIVGKLLLDWLAPPGTGNTDDFAAKAFSQVYAEVVCKAVAPTSPSNVDRATCFIDFKGDPNNLVTAQCVCETALCMVSPQSRKELPPRSDDGFGTPAQLMGQVLFQRLQNNKVRPVGIYTTVTKDDSPQATKVRLYG
eukprot:CAMPEP_0116576674 /NCGR_PEP_ID=MMETSP0397-20121206/20667_1 /TAXON_ID=216820 /ORGANISM="Cyclophora tenuis, Strain ECT3854" /LENGTH=205 /DNA_ID=CAMNT_0004105749 /DNA_START=204 /DNA_END=821 /DNA_ORIENTATION=-